MLVFCVKNFIHYFCTYIVRLNEPILLNWWSVKYFLPISKNNRGFRTIYYNCTILWQFIKNCYKFEHPNPLRVKQFCRFFWTDYAFYKWFLHNRKNYIRHFQKKRQNWVARDRQRKCHFLRPKTGHFTLDSQ
jgi:hypothetical protein